jgi:hypothetical protein
MWTLLCRGYYSCFLNPHLQSLHDWLACLRFLVAFVIPFSPVLEKNLKIGHDCFAVIHSRHIHAIHVKCPLASARLSVHVYQLGFHWTDLLQIWCLRLLWKSGKIQSSLKSNKYEALYIKTCIHLYCSEQYKIFCSSTTVYREHVAFPWEQASVLCCWQWRVSRMQREHIVFCGKTQHFVLFTMMCSSSMQREHILASSWQQFYYYTTVDWRVTHQYT